MALIEHYLIRVVERKLAAEKLQVMSFNESRSEKLIPGEENFEKNDPYKVCYRFLANLGSQWKDLGLYKFPTQWEAVEIAKLADPYFVWLFEQEDGQEQYERLYEFIEDVWNENEE